MSCGCTITNNSGGANDLMVLLYILNYTIVAPVILAISLFLTEKTKYFRVDDNSNKIFVKMGVIIAFLWIFGGYFYKIYYSMIAMYLASIFITNIIINSNTYKIKKELNNYIENIRSNFI